jgi:hypothetical protein
VGVTDGCKNAFVFQFAIDGEGDAAGFVVVR